MLEGGERDEDILKAGDVGLEYQMSKTYSQNLLRNVWGDSADDARERALRQVHRGWVDLERPNSPPAMPPCALLSPSPRLHSCPCLTCEMLRMDLRRDSGPAGGRPFIGGERGAAGMPGRGMVAVAWV